MSMFVVHLTLTWIVLVQLAHDERQPYTVVIAATFMFAALNAMACLWLVLDAWMSTARL